MFCAAKVLPLPILTAVTIRLLSLPASTIAALTAPAAKVPTAPLRISAVRTESVLAVTSILLFACMVLPVRLITLLPLSLTVAPIPAAPTIPPATLSAIAVTSLALLVSIVISPSSSLALNSLSVTVTVTLLLLSAFAASAPKPANPLTERPSASSVVLALSCAKTLTFLAASFASSSLILLLPVVLTSATTTLAPTTPAVPWYTLSLASPLISVPMLIVSALIVVLSALSPVIFTPTLRFTLSMPTPTLPAAIPADAPPSVISILSVSAAFALTVPPASISLLVMLTLI